MTHKTSPIFSSQVLNLVVYFENRRLRVEGTKN